MRFARLLYSSYKYGRYEKYASLYYIVFYTNRYKNFSSGCPAISIPIYLSKEGLPISLQIIGRNFEDDDLLQLANWLENTVSFPHLVS